MDLLRFISARSYVCRLWVKEVRRVGGVTWYDHTAISDRENWAVRCLTQRGEACARPDLDAATKTPTGPWPWILQAFDDHHWLL